MSGKGPSNGLWLRRQLPCTNVAGAVVALKVTEWVSNEHGGDKAATQRDWAQVVGGGSYKDQIGYYIQHT